MQKYPLTIITKASQILGIKKNKLKNKLKSGIISGEKLTVDGKLKWFIHAEEMENLLNQIIEFSDNFEAQRQNIEGLDNVFESNSIPNTIKLKGKKIIDVSHNTLKALINEWQVNFNSLKQLNFDLTDRLEKLETVQYQYQEEIELLKIKNNLLEREVNLLVTQSKTETKTKKTFWAKLTEFFLVS